MGYEEPEPFLQALSETLKDLTDRIAVYYERTPDNFKQGYLPRLKRVLEEVERLSDSVRSFGEASQHAGRGKLQMSSSETWFDWFAVSGVPVYPIWYSIGQKNQYRALSDVSQTPSECEIVVYTEDSDEAAFESIRDAALALAEELGYENFNQTDLQRGSIFGSWRGKVRGAVGSDFVRDQLSDLQKRIEIEVTGRAEAELQTTFTDNAVKLMEKIAETGNAVVRVGAIMIIKQTDADGVASMLVRQLTKKEVRAIELNPGIQRQPASALELLAAAVAQLDDDLHEGDEDGGPQAQEG